MVVVERQYLRILFCDLRWREFDIPKLRGYLAQVYPQYDLIHNHLSNGRLRYAYPVIQFKVLDNCPALVGIGAGIEILKKVFLDIATIDLNGQVRRINEKSILMDKVVIGRAAEPLTYRFLLPWMGLNQENHATYLILPKSERQPFLENILRGNLKSLAKGLDYFIPDFDTLHLQADLTPVTRNFKNNRMLCFNGSFKTDFLIPDYLGLGKQTARGFGTVVRMAET